VCACLWGQRVFSIIELISLIALTNCALRSSSPSEAEINWSYINFHLEWLGNGHFRMCSSVSTPEQYYSIRIEHPVTETLSLGAWVAFWKQIYCHCQSLHFNLPALLPLRERHVKLTANEKCNTKQTRDRQKRGNNRSVQI